MDKQLSLLSAEDMELVTEDGCKAVEFKQGIYSGEGLKASDPDKYDFVLSLLCSGRFTWREIRSCTGVSMGLISGVLKSQASDIEAIKTMQAAESRMISGMTNQALVEWLRGLLDDPARISKMTPTDFKSLTTAGAIATDKALVQTGQATAIIQSIDGTSGADDFEEQFNALQLADVEELPAMGCAAEDSETKEPAGSVAGDDAAQPGEVVK